MKLYSFFRSSAAYRVRIALNLKGLGYDYLPVHLSRGGGEQLNREFRSVNPQALVPVLQDGGQVFSQSLEARLAGNPAAGKFCHGDTPGIADCCLVPQMFNARRFKCDLSPYPTLLAIDRNCQALAAVQRAAPERQPDAE